MDIKPQEHPVALAMAAAVVANLAIVRLGGAALSEAELVAVALFVQTGAGIAATRFTRSKASLEKERRPRSGLPRSEKGEPR